MRALPTILAATALALTPASMAWADPGHAGHDHAVEATYGRPDDPAKGSRVVQDDSKTATVPLQPAEPNKLVGALAQPLGWGARVVDSATMADGHTVQARFVNN